MDLKKIAIHSVPRSGSTWVGSIFDSSPQTAYRFQPLFSYAHKGQLDVKASRNEIDEFFNDIFKTTDSFVLQKDYKVKELTPRFNKDVPTHLVYKEVRYHNILENLLQKDDDVIVIGIVRSPFATICSWLMTPKEFKKELGWLEEEEWRFAPKKNSDKPEEFNGFEKWKEVTKLFLKLNQDYPNQFYLLSYDDLLQNTETEIKKMFKFCQLEMSEQTHAFLTKSTSSTAKDDDPYSVFKSKKKDNAWKNNLPSFIEEEIKADKEFKKLNFHFKWV
ncbi:sulfotransferase domain-containing protein [Aequorivita marina]|uniref:sulfotransferase domain-containing protein n=1 Tax=Aequorivita marina TaxID=3073654 RepID=UPI002874DEB3|nr:sulfotransferase domain-containing protein [Aequorivita sp. S2608]MDS1299078.1 sulfotransferase domain-containing protein [Aequorivita sp. S2608]